MSLRARLPVGPCSLWGGSSSSSWWERAAVNRDEQPELLSALWVGDQGPGRTRRSRQVGLFAERFTGRREHALSQWSEDRFEDLLLGAKAVHQRRRRNPQGNRGTKVTPLPDARFSCASGAGLPSPKNTAERKAQ
jgi:hypothetical protein